MSGKSEDQIRALYEIWYVLRRYRWRFVMPMFLVMAGILAASLIAPRKYEAAVIFERRTDMVLAEITTRGASPALQDPRQSMIEELAGGSAVDAVLAQMYSGEGWGNSADLGDSGGSGASGPSGGAWARPDPAGRQKLRRGLRHKLNVSYDIMSSDIDRVRVSLIGNDPNVARFVVNKLVDNYIDGARGRIEERLRQCASFFGNEVDRSRDLIGELEDKQLSFEIEHAHLLPDNPNSILALISRTQMQREDLIQQYDATSMRIEALKQALLATPATAPSVIKAKNPMLTQLEEKLRELTSQRDLYRSLYKMRDQHPDLVVLDEQIAAAKAKMANVPREVVTHKQISENPKRAELDLKLTEAQSRERALKQQVAAVDEQLSQSNDQVALLFPIRSDYRQIQSDVSQARRQLTFWEDNRRHVQLSVTAESGDRGVQLDFIKPCESIQKPVSPSLLKTLRQKYDHVIIDTPPVVELADAGILGAQSDDVLLIARMNRTARPVIEMAIRTLTSYNAPVAGLIATDQSRSQRRYYYKYTYGYPYYHSRYYGTAA